MRKIKFLLRSSFTFSKAERNGVLVLSFILLMIFTANYYVKNYNDEGRFDFSDFEKRIDPYFVHNNQPSQAVECNKYSAFDPNRATYQELINAGFSGKQAANIVNYRNSIGAFQCKADLKKIYSISNKQFNEMLDYIVITEDFKPAVNQKHHEQKEDKKLFIFNPNTANDSVLEDLGFSRSQIQNIKNYRAKGGRFDKKEDLAKMYAISSEFYAKLENYIRIDSVEKNEENKSIIENLHIDINSASAEDLKQIQGIGNYYSGLVIKYRDLLGGYYCNDQFSEIYNMKQEVLDLLIKNIDIEQDRLTKISINTDSVQVLARHPYIEWKVARGIVSFRKQKGDFKKVDDLLFNYLMPEKDYKRVKPYLSL
ncbi:MAG: hypothetical protein C0594_01700 [Marinilabiliales bacterium]|nr:MAG: hypothetical protein C0594_01700 [Marinilabiliales bacterium]